MNKKQEQNLSLMNNFSLIEPTSVDIETERALMAAMINDGSCVSAVLAVYDVKMVIDVAIAKVFEAICKVFERGDFVSLISVSKQMIKDGFNNRKCLIYLTELTKHAASGMLAEKWAIQLADAYMRRDLNKLAIEVVGKTCDLAQDTGDIIDYQNTRVDEILSFAKIDAQICNISEVTSISIALAKERVESRKSGAKTGIYSAIDELDFILGGFKKKKLYILAGRPGMGKTSVSLGIMKNAAKIGAKCAFFSLEMPKEDVTDKLILSECDIIPENYRDGFLKDGEFETLDAAKTSIDQLPIVVDDSVGLSIRKLKSKISMAKKKRGIDMVVIDYLQLMKATEKNNREQEIAELSGKLKEISKEFDIAVIALSQLNRGVESRADKIPMLSDLRESGAIEQDADVVMFAYRPEYYGMDSFPNDLEQTTKGVGQLIIAKHRGGRCGEAYFSYDKAMNKIGTPNKIVENEQQEFKQDPIKGGFEDAKIPF